MIFGTLLFFVSRSVICFENCAQNLKFSPSGGKNVAFLYHRFLMRDFIDFVERGFQGLREESKICHIRDLRIWYVMLELLWN